MDKVFICVLFYIIITNNNLNHYFLLLFLRDEKKTWIISLFFGAMMLFSVRTVMSVCALEISKEFNYDKTQMVNILFD